MNNGNGNIIRKHTKDKEFTVIDNNIFKNTELSLKAKGLITMMLSFSDNWEFSINGLAKLSTDGVSSVRSGLDELEEKGYLEREKADRNSGKFSKMIFHIYEIPTVCEKPTRINRHGKTDTDKPTRILAYNKELSNKVLNNKELSNKELISLGETYECQVNFLLKDETQYFLDDDYYNSLIDLFGKLVTDVELRKMSLWLQSNPSKRKTKVGMKRFITNWLNSNHKTDEKKVKVKPETIKEKELTKKEEKEIEEQWKQLGDKYGSS